MYATIEQLYHTTAFPLVTRVVYVIDRMGVTPNMHWIHCTKHAMLYYQVFKHA